MEAHSFPSQGHDASPEARALATSLLKAIANDQRLCMLQILDAAGELSVGLLVERTGLGQSATSQHLRILRDAGLVSTRRESQTIYYRLSDVRVSQIMAVLGLL